MCAGHSSLFPTPVAMNQHSSSRRLGFLAATDERKEVMAALMQRERLKRILDVHRWHIPRCEPGSGFRYGSEDPCREAPGPAARF
ncbi:hypothetical protein VTK56DRAFT_8932 [Thermocarpiscus australiensis]